MTREEFIERCLINDMFNEFSALTAKYDPSDFDFSPDGDTWIGIKDGKVIETFAVETSNKYSNFGDKYQKGTLKEFAKERCLIEYFGQLWDMIHA